MTHTLTSDALLRMTASPQLPLVAQIAVRFAGAVTAWDARARSRKALAKLDDRLLCDIGVSAKDARTEAARMFWRL